jgi:hypothetical protein
MTSKSSAEARQRYINVIVEARTLCQGPHGLILPPEDAATEEKKKQKLLAELELVSTNALKMEAHQWSQRLGDMIDLSWLDQEQSHEAVSRKAAKTSAEKRTEKHRQLRADIIERGRLLVAERPELRRQRDKVYDLLELSGIIARSTFQRRYWSEIRK